MLILLAIFARCLPRMSKQWFHSWFNSPYYHLLYRQRNTAEAKDFTVNLNSHLQLQPHARLLDVGCGRGRHACLLHQYGYDVTGIDLSVANIAYALRYQTSGLQFFAHDMRSLYYQLHFDAVVNLFTSFGYFATDEQHLRVLKNMANALKPGGILVLDYLNSDMITCNLATEEVREIEGITFYLQKRIEDNRVVKKIFIEDHQHTEQFEEHVALFTYNDFSRMFKESGFEIVNTYGNYQMAPFDAGSSDRLIFICKKAHD